MFGKKTRIGYLTAKDPYDNKSWSGVHFSMAKALEKHVGEVIPLGPVRLHWPHKIGYKLEQFFEVITGKKYLYGRGVIFSLLYSFIFNRRINRVKPDIIIAVAAYTETAFIKTNIPILFIHDATTVQLIDFYEGLTNLHPLIKREIAYLNRRVIKKASKIIMSSQWAADSVLKDLKGNQFNTFVIPFGSNFPIEISQETVLAKLYNNEKCNLLFMGGEWKRKGGKLAYNTMLELNNLGLKSTLTVIGGNTIESYIKNDPRVIHIPFLNMGKEKELTKLKEIFKEADFFILPSRAECAAIAFCDASAFGIPSAATNIGGISSFIEDGKNGFMLPLSSTAKDYAKHIYKIYCDKERYLSLRQTSRLVYEERLNWNVWAKELKKLIYS